MIKIYFGINIGCINVIIIKNFNYFIIEMINLYHRTINIDKELFFCYFGKGGLN